MWFLKVCKTANYVTESKTFSPVITSPGLTTNITTIVTAAMTSSMIEVTKFTKWSGKHKLITVSYINWSYFATSFWSSLKCPLWLFCSAFCSKFAEQYKARFPFLKSQDKDATWLTSNVYKVDTVLSYFEVASKNDAVEMLLKQTLDVPWSALLDINLFDTVLKCFWAHNL